MKVEIGEKEQQALLDKIIDKLSNTDTEQQGYIFGRSEIEKEFNSAMNKKLKIIMVDLLNNKEFDNKLVEIGRSIINDLLSTKSVKSITRYISTMELY